MNEPMNISDEATAAANAEVHEVNKPIGYHVQQLLNAETEKLRKENEELKKYIADYRSCVRGDRNI